MASEFYPHMEDIVTRKSGMIYDIMAWHILNGEIVGQIIVYFVRIKSVYAEFIHRILRRLVILKR